MGQGGLRPPVQVDGKMHVDCWIQQVTTRVGGVTCWIQQSVSPKQVVGFSCLFNFDVDQLISKVIVPKLTYVRMESVCVAVDKVTASLYLRNAHSE